MSLFHRSCNSEYGLEGIRPFLGLISDKHVISGFSWLILSFSSSILLRRELSILVYSVVNLCLSGLFFMGGLRAVNLIGCLR